jgi:hypothetical protein
MQDKVSQSSESLSQQAPQYSLLRSFFYRDPPTPQFKAEAQVTFASIVGASLVSSALFYTVASNVAPNSFAYSIANTLTFLTLSPAITFPLFEAKERAAKLTKVLLDRYLP